MEPRKGLTGRFSLRFIDKRPKACLWWKLRIIRNFLAIEV